jgi:hypothetical protein
MFTASKASCSVRRLGAHFLSAAFRNSPHSRCRILGILGLSQVVYIAGKLVTESSASQVNAVITDLHNAEADFREAALTYRPSAGAAMMAPPANVDEAIARVGAAAYAKYIDKAKAAAKLFTSTTGLVVEREKLKPSIGNL